MNEVVQLNLAFILFLPWYLILTALYWVFPRQPRTLARRGFDLASLALATLATIASTQWSYLHADDAIDAIWPQVLATAVSYGVFLGVMTAACLVRHRLVVRPHAARRVAPDPTPALPGAL